MVVPVVRGRSGPYFCHFFVDVPAACLHGGPTRLVAVGKRNECIGGYGVSRCLGVRVWDRGG